MRNEARVPVIAVGAISSWDDVNSLILAGRTDLCALARPHLYDPHWTLHAAAEQGYEGPGVVWPPQYRAGSRPPRTGRTDAPRPRLTLSGLPLAQAPGCEAVGPRQSVAESEVGFANSAPASRSRSCSARKTDAERVPGQSAGSRPAGRPGSVYGRWRQESRARR